jgi:hypothetical protein
MTIKRLAISFLVFTVATASIAYAANKILVAKGTAITFLDTGGTAAITLSALAAGTGCTTACTRCSAQYTKTGANVKSQLWEMRVKAQLTGTNVLNEPIEYYVATSDGTLVQGNIATTNSTIDINKRKNLTFAGILSVDQTTTNTTMVASFPNIVINEVAFQVCASNQTTLPFKTDTAVHGITMTPMDIEVQ